MKNKIINAAFGALSAAMVFVITRFIQIPIPLGYVNLGNSLIMLICLLIPAPYAAVGAGLGSALADLTCFPVYTAPTLVIKSLMAVVFCLIAKKNPHKAYVKIIAAAVSALIPVICYTGVGMVIYGGFAAGLAQLPGLLAEYGVNVAVFIILMKPVEKAKKYIRF